MLRNLILLAIALLSFVAWGWPNLKVAVRILCSRRTRSRFVAGPEGIVAGSFPAASRKLISAMESLGFLPLGIKQEKRPFLKGQELAFAAPERKCFASIHRFQSDSPLYYFYTPYQDGAVVLTNPLAIDGLRIDGFYYGCLPGRSVADIFAEHCRRADNMAAAGHATYDQFDQPARLRATDGFYQNLGATLLERRRLSGPLRSATMSLLLVVLAVAWLVWSIF